MLMTVCALIIAFFMGFFIPAPIDFEAQTISSIMLVGGAIIFLATLFLNVYILLPISNLEQKLIPHLTDLLKKDLPLKWGRFYLFLFSLMTMICVAFVARIQNVIYQDWFFLGWLVLFGLALDVLRDSWGRLLNFLNPSFLIQRISKDAIKTIQNDADAAFLSHLDNLSEIALHAVEKSKLALSSQTLQALPPIIQTFLDSAKSITHISRELEPKKKGGDEASYTLFYLVQRLELIFDKALRERAETVCRQMIMTLGKIIIYSAKYDVSLMTFPLHFLTKFGLKAQQHHLDEVSELTTSTLLEIAKTVLTEIDITYMELQDPFKAIINGLSALARGSFKKRKDSNIKVLIQPLEDLRKMFETEKMSKHPDTPIILQEINKVLEEFTILQQVMQTMPVFPEMDKETTSNETI